MLQYNLQFFAKDGDGGEKTEPATAKKLEKAREEGQVTKSQELGNAASLVALFIALRVFISFVGERMVGSFTRIFNAIPDVVATDRKGLSTTTVSSVILDSILQILIMCAPFFIIGVVVAFIVTVVQVKLKVTLKPLMPKFSKFNPVNGFKRIFSTQSIFNLLLSIVKIILIFYIAYMSIKDHANELFILYDLSLWQAIGLIGDIIIDTGLRIALVYIIVGIADYIFQRHKFNEDMKMTKKEIKDEYKDAEGDPQIKGQQRQRMREASMRRMMQDVPKADVVITNPTHVAVALTYNVGESGAPVVIAKGIDFLAERIKEVARDNDILVKEDVYLARSLYAACDIGQEIPPELYEAVAVILAEINRFNPNLR
ncbi:MAG: flagellar biosynthesis protein FlhB [Lachnospiraceae bacterium]|nr:flagellar biosynthesis protein FlhB [Lachnospiraceae bacterium]